jgi:hypothetical protein
MAPFLLPVRSNASAPSTTYIPLQEKAETSRNLYVSRILAHPLSSSGILCWSSPEQPTSAIPTRNSDTGFYEYLKWVTLSLAERILNIQYRIVQTTLAWLTMRVKRARRDINTNAYFEYTACPKSPSHFQPPTS